MIASHLKKNRCKILCISAWEHMDNLDVVFELVMVRRKTQD